MKRFLKFIDSNFNFLMLVLINLIVFVYIVLAIAAPILKYLGHKDSADFIYFIYSFLCHQKPERSFLIFGYQMAFCARDLFIFTSFLIIGVLSFFRKIKLKKLSIPVLFLFTIPILLDGAIQLISNIFAFSLRINEFYASTNFLRFITGTIFGTGLGLFFIPILKHEEADKSNNMQIAAITFFLSFVIYLLLII